MTPTEIEAILQQIFEECEATGYPLNAQQREILFRMLINQMASQTPDSSPSPHEDNTAEPSPSPDNPLNELTLEQRRALLEFIQTEKRQNRSWKARLLNDWLNNQTSGAIQFIREQYGLPWLARVRPEHIAQYADETPLTLKVGDRIEVSNGLWEWVQEDGPCSREWFPCTVVSVTAVSDASIQSTSGYDRQTNCIVRFDNGMEYEIQGVYEWNRYNWRWATD